MERRLSLVSATSLFVLTVATGCGKLPGMAKAGGGRVAAAPAVSTDPPASEVSTDTPAAAGAGDSDAIWEKRRQFNQLEQKYEPNILYARRVLDPDVNLTLGNPGDLFDKLRAVEEECRKHDLAATGDRAKAFCATAADWPEIAEAYLALSIKKWNTELEKGVASVEKSAAAGAVSRKNAFLAPAKLAAERIATDTEIARTGRLRFDPAPIEAAATAAEARVQAALAGGARTFRMPKALIVSKAFTGKVARDHDLAGKLLAAGIGKDTIEPIKNDFGVTIGHSGTAYALVAPPGQSYCVVRRIRVGSDRDRKEWHIESIDEILDLSTCK